MERGGNSMERSRARGKEVKEGQKDGEKARGVM